MSETYLSFDVSGASAFLGAAAVCVAPIVIAAVVSGGNDNGLGNSWQRACTIHSILCCFFLLDLVFDVLITGLKNGFVAYCAVLYIEQFVSAVTSRYFRRMDVIEGITAVDDIFIVWILLVLLRKCHPTVWTRARIGGAFIFAFAFHFLYALLWLFKGSLSLQVLALAIQIFSCIFTLYLCACMGLSIEVNGLKNEYLSVDEKRGCLLIFAVVIYYAASFYSFLGGTKSYPGSENANFPSYPDLYLYKYLNTALLAVLSYIPWKISCRSLIENRVRDDVISSLLKFLLMSCMFYSSAVWTQSSTSYQRCLLQFDRDLVSYLVEQRTSCMN